MSDVAYRRAVNPRKTNLTVSSNLIQFLAAAHVALVAKPAQILIPLDFIDKYMEIVKLE